MPDQAANNVIPLAEINIILLSDGNITTSMKGTVNLQTILQMTELAKYKLCQMWEAQQKKVVIPQNGIDLKRLRG